MPTQPYRLEAGANLVDPPRSFSEKLIAWLPTQLITGIYGRIARGGHLYLTDTALLFEPHGLNIVEMGVELDLRAITVLRSRQRMAAALLTVGMASGEEIDFVCWERRKVIDAVRQAQADLGITPAT